MTETPESAPDEKQDVEQDPILRKLRKVYNDVAEEPLPDRLIELLTKLDEAERKR